VQIITLKFDNYSSGQEIPCSSCSQETIIRPYLETVEFSPHLTQFA